MRRLSFVVTLLLAVPAAAAATPAGRVAVQPFDGPGAPALRAQVTRLLRARRLRVVTGLPAVSGTGQYPELARQRRIAAFLVAGIEERGGRRSVTFLVWHGLPGTVAGRWTVAAPTRKLPRAVAKGLWKALAPSLLAAPVPPSNRLRPAPPMRIDAGSPLDDAVVGAGFQAHAPPRCAILGGCSDSAPVR